MKHLETVIIMIKTFKKVLTVTKICIIMVIVNET